MIKYLKIPVYEHPHLDYSDFTKSKEYTMPGFHTLKDQTGTYLRFGTPGNLFVSNLEFPSAMMLFEYKEPEAVPGVLVSSESQPRGISEDTLLKALAIAQDPTLALNLLK